MQQRQSIKRKILWPAFVITASVMFGLLMQHGLRSRSVDYSPLNTYAEDQIRQLEIQVTQREAMIQQLVDRISHGDSLILLLENKRASITNKYYYNEKEILTSGDSVNRAMRIVNQHSFESDYFSGKYTPTK